MYFSEDNESDGDNDGNDGNSSATRPNTPPADGNSDIENIDEKGIADDDKDSGMKR